MSGGPICNVGNLHMHSTWLIRSVLLAKKGGKVSDVVVNAAGATWAVGDDRRLTELTEPKDRQAAWS